MNIPVYDLVIIGAGPAGMSAAATASSHGLKIVILDEQTAPGGQIYRSISNPAIADENILGADYYHGRSLLTAMRYANVDYLPGSIVWAVSPDLSISFSRAGKSSQIKAKKLLIATGAQERPVPFPGWTLPGVLTCGAAQILLKSSGLTPAAPLILAGSGPLLLLIAAQLNRAGVEIEAILDTTPKGRYLKSLRYLPAALRNLPLLIKGVGLLVELKRSGIRYVNNVSQLKALPGSNQLLSKLQYSVDNRIETSSCTTLLVHQGVVPNVQLTRALQLEHQWDELQQCWKPSLDSWGESSQAGIFVAGDSGGIAGARAAEYMGELTAQRIAQQLGKLNKESLLKQTAKAGRLLYQQQAIRPFLDAMYQPADEFLKPSDETLVCRCEEVTAGQIRGMVAQGCTGPNQTKAFSRAGMGPCQGRLCGLTVAQIIADERKVPVKDVGYYKIRSPIKPLTIGEIADLAE
ncbi:FAD-dependent oxidoreductase [Neptunomonas antarctica]|uniref:NADPH-dependent 2,4-dienoyl-CoA reductase, sulfur reductase n=1 Tax=Neptunomonas antarctica TaxID=619304 RepID=A0A1N7NW80_9GAMM|nr:FAD-dependent oxidoreductase [Neptunomonas antarctica]SIT02459.1 NADPH-dependent 2,4-dienoyl-CoA reductase, sulfur reductase [Neptunomonas antarctica]